MQNRICNKPRQAGTTMDANFDIPAYDRNRLNGLLQMPLRMR